MNPPALPPPVLTRGSLPRNAARPTPLWLSLLRLSAVLVLCLCPGLLRAQSWSGQDIGSVSLSGSESFNASTSTYTLQGAGADIQGTADAFYFFSQPLSLDGELVVRVTSQQNTDPWAKAGLMVRQDTSAGSAEALLALTPGHGVIFQERLASGATTGRALTTAAMAAPVWLKLVKDATLLSAFYGTDGVSWTYLGGGAPFLAHGPRADRPGGDQPQRERALLGFL